MLMTRVLRAGLYVSVARGVGSMWKSTWKSTAEAVTSRWLWWKPGRQHTGYRILKLFDLRLPRWSMDTYIIRCPQGSWIPEHTDTVPSRKHWRLNLVLWAPEKGGDLVFKRSNVVIGMNHYKDAHLKYKTWEFKRKGVAYRRLLYILFRPDILTHSMRRIDRGSLWMLSIGFTW